MQQNAISPRVALFVTTVVLAGGTVLAMSAHGLWQAPIGNQWLLFALLTVVSSAFPLRVPGITASLSVADAFVFAPVLIYGPEPATIIVALDGLVLSLLNKRRRLYRTVFNVAGPAVSLWTAAQAFTLLAPDQSPRDLVTTIELLGALGVLTAAYFAFNSGLNALAVAIESGRSFWQVWAGFRWTALNHFGGASLAVLISSSSEDGLNLVALVMLVPLLTIFYLSFRTTMARAEEANSHLAQLNKLYLSTIETLAMAIDAKDQITHGHIRRVQQYAVGLARKLGVSGTSSLKAIEAAALLHDMGKLAIPEHILNKPGKLSAAEFETMKKHADIGADILSRIDFPYPVVPIVRYHHEHWDGKGYPTGIAGEAIPIGARILSVVDCFDALTSDRPYRRALSDEAAIRILLERRGTMYDPRVVDTFIAAYRELAPREADPSTAEDSMAPLVNVRVPEVEGTEAAPMPDESVSAAGLLGSLRDLAGGTPLSTVAWRVSAQFEAVMPVTLTAFYLYDLKRGDLKLAEACGVHRSMPPDLRIRLGERLSGWVAANRRPIRNGDAALDFLGLRGPSGLPLGSCISVPLVAGDELVGVMTLYSDAPSAFTPEQCGLVEWAAPVVAHLVRGSVDLQTVRRGVRHATATPDRDAERRDQQLPLWGRAS